MVNAFVDGSVVVDILRQHSPAQVWFQQQPLLGITPHVWLEVLDGVLNMAEQKRAFKHFKPLLGNLAQKPY